MIPTTTQIGIKNFNLLLNERSTPSFYLQNDSIKSINERSCFVCCVYHWEDNTDEYFEQLLPGQLNYVPTFKNDFNLHSFVEQHNFLID